MLTVGLACLLALLAITIIVLNRAHEASRSGELRYWVRGIVGEQVIRRKDDPKRFELELMILRAVPWIGFSFFAISALMFGFFL